MVRRRAADNPHTYLLFTHSLTHESIYPMSIWSLEMFCDDPKAVTTGTPGLRIQAGPRREMKKLGFIRFRVRIAD